VRPGEGWADDQEPEVVDTSVFPRIPGFFIVTAVYMIGEKASDAILADVTAGMGFVRRMIGRVTRRGTLG
jgi:hypothetical protein